MKLHLSLITSAVSVAAIMSNVFADTAVTDPVGYVTTNIAGSAGPNLGNTFSVVSPTLVRPIEYAGIATAVSATQISFAANSFTPTQVTAFGTGQYWIEVTNGATSEGAWTNITGATLSTVTTADSMIPFITPGTSTVKIRKHVTVSDYFGATNSAGLGAGGDPGAADEVIFYDGSTFPATTTEVFYDGATWNDGNFAPANDKIIEPGQGLLVVHKTATDFSFVSVGHVKTGKSQISFFGNVDNNDVNIAPVPQAVGVTLNNSGLYTGVATTGVLAGGDPGSADEVILFDNEGNSKSYFYDGTAWNDGDFLPAGNTMLKEGSGIYLVHKLPTNFVWTAPAVTIAP